ncbi:hypothetical protein [Candidatus Tisiphia endosymbiont of Metellina segmentata]|uniref:hypothetical protein n=1 Tax=Candidatus Tisiphia endosymbiont of Metellina segmentata TaxID=3066274 RepID=UPI00313D8783
MDLTLDFFRNSTSAGDLDNDAALESVTELEYAAVRGEASPSNPSAQASFERAIIFYLNFIKIDKYYLITKTRFC